VGTKAPDSSPFLRGKKQKTKITHRFHLQLNFYSSVKYLPPLVLCGGCDTGLGVFPSPTLFCREECSKFPLKIKKKELETNEKSF